MSSMKSAERFLCRLIEAGFGRWFNNFMERHGVTKSDDFALYVDTEKAYLERFLVAADRACKKRR